jgi:8-oxo-dGTP pyrophosphatase MutT (NUDIX family)
VPYRVAEELQFCLVTSTRGRWIFPKGYIDPGEDSEETALKEAYEEAGVRGELVGSPIGSYRASKKCHDMTVEVHLLEVHHVDDAWPESVMRQRRWVSAREAREMLNEPALVPLLKVAMERIDAH